MYTYKNKSLERKLVHDNAVFMGAQSSITQSDIYGYANINDFSHINNCSLGQSFGVGLFSYVANSSIGNYCTFGSRLSIGAFPHPTDWLSVHEFQYRDTTNIYGESLYSEGENILKDWTRPTTIGSDVWIADNSVVLKGVKLGNGAIVAASSIVTKDVPPYAIVAGNPAKIIRYRFDKVIISELEQLKWWNLNILELRDIRFDNIDQAIEDLKIKRRKSTSLGD